MSKLIKDWSDLKDLESENYKIILENTGHCGWIEPKIETEETEKNWYDHHYYLSTHTFYEDHHATSTRILHKFGFDVELESWD